ncbi:MAG: asparagine synthase (glutamine-hydrolyzing) [Deltaproteobacteria bacterium]|nr:asparagine synthase (glutamine-hydrolyzing) [Deltaproteobacteria bacterium]
MCGIAGFAGLKLSLDRARSLGEAMNQAIAYRGPDGGGVSVHYDATLGMRRLAIVDIANGHQPMFSDDGAITLVYNGEVYNAPALRESLQRDGVQFVTRSDTEVILRLYERDPDLVEELLVGMWAFAIHDRRRDVLVLSRDRFGIKPLFVVEKPGAIGFASDLRALRALESEDGFTCKFAVDHGSAHAMLSWGFVPELATIYEGVARVEPGTRVELDLRSGAKRRRTYWTLTPSSEASAVSSMADAALLTESVLRRAVREHLESDVPVASFLSGGIDSSLVTLFAAQASARPVEAFTIGFREELFDESVFAKQIAEQIGVSLRTEVLEPDSLRKVLADAMLAYDEPFGDSSSLATYLLSQVVGRSHKVSLAGDGGDEVFVGYSRYRLLPVRAALRGQPAMRDALGHLLMKVPSRTDRTSRLSNGSRVLRRLARGLVGDDAEAYVTMTQFGTLAQTAPLMRRPLVTSRFETPAIERFHSAKGTVLQKVLAGDLRNPLPNDMLTKVDRASMASQLEARVPFLDHRVVEMGVGLPPQYTHGVRGKEVLRVLYKRHFGGKLADRKKHGFGVPVERWLKTSLAPACDALFARERLDTLGVLSSDELSNGGWKRWAERDPQLLWNAFALAVWCEATFGIGSEGIREVLSVSPTHRVA